MSDNYLNLARKWRSKHFDEIVGQELAIRLIKNGLYRNLIFPVYLLSGQRGSGKTSTARIFAAALNCDKLETFQKEPKGVQLPCLECVSCKAMQNLSHPDFVEIDAASNTGVDNVRQIIDAASFVPVMGKKKIYLVDEAHMLSKAAFNALLKILEEPPKSAMFFLATTDSSKIIDTVKSRCFQLFFNSIAVDDLSKHLSYICEKEEIPFDVEGIRCVSMQTEGSARDALNLIERIRLAHDDITKSTVYKTLGFIDDETLCNLFSAVFVGNEKDLLEFCVSINLSLFDPSIIFKRFVSLIRTALWIKLGVKIEVSESIKEHLEPLVGVCSSNVFVSMLELCYTYETAFSKTARAADVLELLLIKLCIGSRDKDSVSNVSLPSSNTVAPSLKPVSKVVQQPGKSQAAVPTSEVKDGKWQTFLSEIGKLEDPLIKSIFRQANVAGLDKDHAKIDVVFNKNLSFYNDMLQSSASMWLPIFKKIFVGRELVVKFDGVALEQPKKKNELVTPVPNMTSAPRESVRRAAPKEQRLQVIDAEKWAKANIITKVFPGVISCIASDKT